MSNLVLEFAELGRVWRRASQTSFAEPFSIADRAVLSQVQDLLEEEIGELDGLIGVTLNPDTDTFTGRARQRLSVARSQTYEFTLSPEQIVYKLIDADQAAQFAEEHWAEIVQYATKTGSRAGKKLNCKPGNMQCGGKCQNGKFNCRFVPSAEQKTQIKSAIQKASKSKQKTSREIADDLAKDPKTRQFISLITQSKKSDKQILNEMGLSTDEGLKLVNNIRQSLGVRPDQSLKDRLVEIYKS
jgi:hypothetical protein